MKEEWLSATLAQKIPRRVGSHGLQSVKQVLSREASGLETDWEFSAEHEWLEVRTKGPDAGVFLSLLKEKFGEAPRHYSELKLWDIRNGYIVGAGRVGFGVYVDLGVIRPTRKDALFPLHRMRSQLVDGEVKSCREILKENALVDDFPVNVVVIGARDDRVTVELADETWNMLAWWKKLPFERVIALGATSEMLEKAVRASKLDQDIVRVEPMSMLAHCMVCKRGTDAPGVVSRMGRHLRGISLLSYRTALPSLTLTTH